MSFVYVLLINLILLFIFYVVLNHKINKNSTSALLDRYAREVENLIVELNRTVDDLLNLSEERINELKKLIKRAEKLLKNQGVKKAILAEEGESVSASRSSNPADSSSSLNSSKISDSKSLMEKTGHLLAMGHTKDEIADILKINRAEVDFLESLLNKGR